MDPSTNQPAAAIPNPNVLATPQAQPEQLPAQTGAVPEQVFSAPAQEAQVQNSVEQAPVPNAQPAAQPVAQLATAPLATPTAQAGQVWSDQVHIDAVTARQNHAQGVAEYVAEDVDLIEKPWVEKTEQVIETDKDDPYKEDEAKKVISKVYVKKRFNIDVS